MTYERPGVIALLYAHVKSESLRKHCFAVEAGMLGYARFIGLDDAERSEWQACGLLHDLDFESHPETHPHQGIKWLTEAGYSEYFTKAVLGHAQDDASARESTMAKVLFAVDELSSFIVAVALMRPEGFDGLGVKSVTKKLKDKAFARAVDRDGIKLGAEALSMELSQLIEIVINGLIEQQAILKNEGLSLI